MAILLTFQGLNLCFPEICLVCKQPAIQHYEISRIISYGSRSAIDIRYNIPLCSQHHALASHKNRAEKIVAQTGLIFGAFVGLAACAGLLFYWNNTSQGYLITNLLLAAVIGLGGFLITWVSLAFFLAPHFADPASKTVRETMKIRRFWPASQQVQLEFSNETVANWIAQTNSEILINLEQIS